MKVQYNIDGMHIPGTEIEIGGTSTLLGATIHSFTVSTWLSLKVGASACISARAMVCPATWWLVVTIRSFILAPVCRRQHLHRGI
jgi:hypothetical protein